MPNGASSVMGSGPSYTVGERPKVDFTPLIQLITASIAPGTWKVFDPHGTDVSSAYGIASRRSSRRRPGPAAPW